jgi:hypothetical protein
MKTVLWQKCGAGWCGLQSVDLTNVVPVIGVYLIWKSTAPGQTVRVGQGNIVARIVAHRNDSQVLAHKPPEGQLAISWAAVEPDELDGVERYLAEKLTPLVKTPLPNAEPIPINLPGS